MRSRPRSLLAGVLTAVLALAGSLVGVQSATAASGDYIDWGVKASFRNYIAGPIAKGSIELGTGATTNADGTYRWPATASTFDPTTGVVTVTTAGSVHFSGHAGALDLTVSSISLSIQPDGASSLSGAVTSTDTGGTVVDYGTVAIAELAADQGTRTVGDGTVDWSGLPAVLTDAGAPAFGGFYAAGAELDPVSFHISGDWSTGDDGEETPVVVETPAPVVEEAPALDSTAGTFEGVTLEWTGNAEMQSTPPAGGSNYFSAGTSNGTQADYRATDGNVSIVQRTATGAGSSATWATRAAYLTGGSQLVRVGGGTAVVAADGSGTIRWTGAWSVNFYGGMIPFTLGNPVLTVAADGTGTLTADVSGYAGDMGDLTKKTPLATVPDVVVATFTNVAINSTTGVVVTPDYAGVAVTVPSTSTQQNRTVSGWGAWPQSWVDFQVATGLSSYWYSSGGSADSKKAPAAFAIGFAGAAVPAVPVTPATPQVTTPDDDDTDSTADDGKDDAKDVTPAKAGSLVWGVKSSFRSYITGPIAKGAISLGDGAKLSGGAYWFGQAKGGTYSTKKGTGSTEYAGSVHFTGHSGLLDLTFSDPVVRITSDSSATLSVRINGGSPVALGAIDLAAAKKSSAKGSVAYSSAPVSLTSAGVAAFSYNGSGFYSVGEPMDAVSFVIGSAAKADSTTTTTVSTFSDDTWTAPSTPPATTGAEFVDAADELHAGDEVTVTATGFEANESDIKVVVYSDPIVLEKKLTADASGTASWSGILPLSLETGEHTLTLQGSVDRGVVFTVADAVPLVGCQVTAASITWAFKESFRSYISGSIANGEWTPSDGATYETPSFGWATATGTYDPETSSGLVSFEGSVRFTGHDGLLDTTIANPQIMFVDENTAYLLLDVSGVTMDDALAGNDEVQVDEAVSFVSLDLSGGTIEVDGSTLTATDIPTAITEEGYAAFPNYEPGTEFDPISFSLTTDTDCAIVAPTEAPVVTEPETTEVAPAAATGLPAWVFWVAAAVLLVLIAAAIVVVVRRRRSKTA